MNASWNRLSKPVAASQTVGGGGLERDRGCGHASCQQCGACTSKVSIFADLPEEDQLSLRRIARHVELQKGQTLFHTGDQANRIIVLRHGRLKLRRQTAEGQEIVMGFLEEGEVLGEDSLYANVPYDSDLVALVDSGVCLILADRVTDLAFRRPQLGASLLRSLGQKLHEARELNDILSRKQAAARLAGFLLHQLTRQPDAVLRLTREDIASSIGLRRETVSRALQRFERMGIVRLAGYRMLQVTQPEVLRLLYEEDHHV